MRLRLLSAALLIVAAPPAPADLTMTGHSTLTALNMPNQGREAIYVKDQRLRRDVTQRGRSYSILYDLKKREVLTVDHFQRQVERQALTAGQAVQARVVKLALETTGRKHALQDWTCEEHRLSASLPGQMGQEKVTLQVDGEIWLERRTGDRKELQPFIKAVAADDFFVGTALPGQPDNGQAQALNEVLRKVLAKGMLCAAEIRLDYQGSGPMADLGRRMATKASIVYEAISDKALADDLFEAPANYRLIAR